MGCLRQKSPLTEFRWSTSNVGTGTLASRGSRMMIFWAGISWVLFNFFVSPRLILTECWFYFGLYSRTLWCPMESVWVQRLKNKIEWQSLYTTRYKSWKRLLATHRSQFRISCPRPAHINFRVSLTPSEQSLIVKIKCW